MKKDFKTQYDPIAESYSNDFTQMNLASNSTFFNTLSLYTEKVKNVIDFACGTGDIIAYFQQKNIACVGVDSSSEMVAFAKKNTGADVRFEDFAHTSFEDESFDLTTSKWAMQTSAEIDPVYTEAHRLLKKGGHLIFLVVHPLRQFLEKKKAGKDYFKKEIVDSIIFNGAITVYEPSHTLKEYLSTTFFSLFTLIDIEEGAEFPAAEQIGGDIYPTYLIIAAQKK